MLQNEKVNQLNATTGKFDINMIMKSIATL